MTRIRRIASFGPVALLSLVLLMAGCMAGAQQESRTVDTSSIATVDLLLRGDGAATRSLFLNLWSSESEEPNDHFFIKGTEPRAATVTKAFSLAWSVSSDDGSGSTQSAPKTAYKVTGSPASMTWTIAADGTVTVEPNGVEAA